MLTINEREYMFERKYRPGTIEECILPEHDKEVFRALVKRGKLPHLILQSNSPGTGKTTVACALANDIDADHIFVNGSGCGIDFIKNELTRFASSKSLEGKQKVIILDEFDRSQLAEAQRYLRSFMDAYGKNCSIIITANNLDGIIVPLKSRAQVIKFGVPNEQDHVNMMKQMIQRCLDVCANEQIKVENPRAIAALVKKNFPDMRETIKQLDHYGVNGVIDDGILSLVMENRNSIDGVLDAIKSRDLIYLRSACPKYAPDYAKFVEMLVEQLLEQIDKPSKLRLYEIVGENNKFHGLAANIELHMMLMFVDIIRDVKFV